MDTAVTLSSPGSGSRVCRIEPPEYELWGRADVFAGAVVD